jgi:streptomycin 6-kinase
VTDVSATKTVSADVFLKHARTRDQLAAEAETLRAFGRHRAVEVREVRTADHTLVLERAHPGASLASLATEDEAMRVLAGLLAPAWPTVPEGTVAEPLAIFARALDGRQPALGRAAGLLAELLQDEREAALLHGDLHYENIVSSDRAGYLLIDPKGVIGAPAFDIGYLVSRPAPSARDALPMPRAIDRRLGFLPQALGLEPQRVASYAYVAAALSMAWAVEDRDGSRDAFEAAMRVLERRIR